MRTLALVLLVGALAAGCSDSAGPAGTRADRGRVARGPVPVVTRVVVASRLEDQVEALGTTRANEAIDITAKTGNTITAIRFREGSAVARGAVLVEMDGAEARAGLGAAEAAVAESRSQFHRSRELFATKALSAAQLEQIEATLKANESRVASARARLDDTIIRAPFAGRTGLRRISPGSLVAPGAVITTLDDLRTLKLDFTLPEAFLGAVRTGLVIEANSIAWPERVFHGRVASVDSRVDPVTRSFTARALLPNADDALKPGMLLTVRLQGPATQVLMIPEGALVPEQGELFVFVVHQDQAEKRRVTLRSRQAGTVAIASGLAVGERLVVEGTLRLRQGSKVQEAAPAPL